MRDAELFSEVIMAFTNGITSASQSKIDAFYEDHDQSFPEGEEVGEHLNHALSHIVNWRQLHKTSLMKPYNFYSLILAVLHTLKSAEPLATLVPNLTPRAEALGVDQVVPNLSLLAASLEEPENYRQLSEFTEAGSSATTTLKNRTIRFQHFLRALNNHSPDATL